MDVIFKNHSVQVRFIDNSTLSGGPLGIPATLSAETLSNLVDVTSAVENFLVLGVLLWRVRVIWSGTGFVIPLTIVSSFIYLVNAGLVLSVNVIVWNAKNPKLAAIPGQAIIFIMASVSSSASLLLMASIIIARLLFIRQKHIRLLGRTDVAGQYLSIAAMLIESYALDSLWNIATIVSFGLKNAPTTSFFNDCVIQVDILTNFLLTYRVLCGRAWTRQTEDRLSTLRWTSNGAGTTTETIDPRQTRVPEGDPPMTDSRNDTYQS